MRPDDLQSRSNDSSLTTDNAQTERRPRYLVLLAVTALFTFGGLALLIATMVSTAMSREQALYRATPAGGWIAAPQGLPGKPNLLRTADDGTLWVRTMFRGSLSRLAGDRWAVFRGADFGTRQNYPYCGFALAGNTVWTSIDRALLRFDGAKWKQESMLPEQFAEEPVAIAAEGNQVWLLDRRGQLWNYAAGRWGAETIPGAVEDADLGSLAVTPGGVLWLVAGQAWRRAPQGQWEPVQIGGQRPLGARLVGRGPDRLWLAEGSQLAWTDFDGKQSGRAPADLAGLANRDEVHSVAQRGGKLLAATSRGLIEIDPASWTANAVPNPGAAAEAGSAVQAVAVGPAGTTFVIETHPMNPTLTWIVCALIVAGSAVLLTIAWRSLRRDRNSSLAIQTWVPITGFIFLAGLNVIFMARDGGAAARETMRLMFPVLLATGVLITPLLYVVTKCFCRMRSDLFERLIFQRVSEQELPAVARRHFERYTGDMELLGFRHVADLRLKRHQQFFCRLFVSDNAGPPSFGELCSQKAAWWAWPMQSCSFVTMLESGDYVETADVATKQYDSNGLHFRSVTSLGRTVLANVYAAHAEAVESLCEESSTYAVPCTLEDFPRIATYGHKLMYERLAEEGIAPRNIYSEPSPAEPPLVEA